MIGYRIVEQVNRRPKPMTGVLRKTMAVLAALFVILGITIFQGFLLIGFLLAGLYFVYEVLSQKDYEYILEDNVLTIAVIKGKKYRKTAHTLDLDEMEVTAPNLHAAVRRYRKKEGTEHLKKFDYTSYDDEIPYYTMIVRENGAKIKLLLDLTDEMLHVMKRQYPDRVFFA